MNRSDTSTSAPESKQEDSANYSWLWDWLFRSIQPEEGGRVKRDEDSNITSDAPEGNDSKESIQFPDTNSTTDMIGGESPPQADELAESESGVTHSFQKNSSEENHFDEDVNKTVTECMGDECDVDLAAIENEILKLENAVLESGQGETMTGAVWNTDKFVENNPWLEMKILGQKHSMADGNNDNPLELEIFDIKSNIVDSNSNLTDIDLINVSPIKSNDSFTELEFNVLLPGNMSQPETAIHFQVQYDSVVNLTTNQTMLLTLAMEILNEIEISELENRAFIFNSIAKGNW
uniref:Uncharacterized protein n=1 Tax=Graphocephala atropunctata TaxID=36148 RepID=A0A1B6MFS4_9HEMI